MNKLYKTIKIGTVEADIFESDIWFLERSNRGTGEVNRTPILKHDAVQRLSDIFGLYPEMALELVGHENNQFTWIWIAKVNNGKGEITEAGTASPSTTKNAYPVEMAFKRAYDRCILKALSLYEFYSDVEAETFRQDNHATPEQRKLLFKIARLVGLKDISVKEAMKEITKKVSTQDLTKSEILDVCIGLVNYKPQPKDLIDNVEDIPLNEE